MRLPPGYRCLDLNGLFQQALIRARIRHSHKAAASFMRQRRLTATGIPLPDGSLRVLVERWSHGARRRGRLRTALWETSVQPTGRATCVSEPLYDALHRIAKGWRQ